MACFTLSLITRLCAKHSIVLAVISCVAHGLAHVHSRPDPCCVALPLLPRCEQGLQSHAWSRVRAQVSQQIVETEHLFKALLEQPNGLARRIVAKAGSNPTELLEKTDAFIRRQPRVTGDSQQARQCT